MRLPRRSGVAFIRLGSLGDVLIATAALKETIRKFPGEPIYVIGSPLWKTVLSPALWPHVTGILATDKKGREERLFVPNNDTWVLAQEQLSLPDLLRRCAAAVNLRIDSFRFLVSAWRAKVPRRHGTCPWYLKFLVTHWAPWLNQRAAIHERDRLLCIVEAAPRRLFPLGFEKFNRRRILHTPEPDYATALQSHWPAHSLPFQWLPLGLPPLAPFNPAQLRKKFALTSKKYWLINPTASLTEKAWPAESFRAFCDEYAADLKRRGIELVITGAPHESDWLMLVAGERFRVIQPESFNDLVTLVAGAEVLVANTSALQFVSAATQTPALTLVGRATPARWGPVGPRDLCLWGKLPPGFRGSFSEEEKISYAAISVPELVEAARRMTASVAWR